MVAYALAGTMGTDLTSEPLGTGSDGQPVWLRDIWPSQAETGEVIASCLRPDMYTREYAHVSPATSGGGPCRSPRGHLRWDPASTYVRRPPFFDALTAEPRPLEDAEGARVLALLGDSVTTDHTRGRPLPARRHPPLRAPPPRQPLNSLALRPAAGWLAGAGYRA